MISELPASKLRWVCDPKLVPVKSTEEMKPIEAMIGQPRAHYALMFGINIREPGFNIYAAGPTGTGKTTTITDFIKDVARSIPVPSDWCYVNNFADEYQPKALECPAGIGRKLRQDLNDVIHAARLAIPQLFQGEDYASKREQIFHKTTQKRQHTINEMSKLAEKEGFTIQLTSIGLSLVPLIQGKPVSDEGFASLPVNQQQIIIKKREELGEKLIPYIKQLRELEIKAHVEAAKFDKDVALYAIEHLMATLLDKYKKYENITEYLREVQAYIIGNLEAFRPRRSEKTERKEEASIEEYAFRVYDVNVIVDNSELKTAPVVIEHNPTYNNLLGRIEKEGQMGNLTTDFTLIRGGSLHRANGGFIMIRAEQLIRDFNVYEGVKRALKNRELRIEDVQERIGYATIRTIAPKPIPLNVKVILVGDAITYQVLFEYDPEFRELFKVKADFDSTMAKDENTIYSYIGFLSAIVMKEKLRHLHASAIARLIEHACRLAEDQNKLSTQFGLIADVVREAHFYALKSNSKLITADQIEAAIEAKVYRSNLAQEKINEYIQRNVILISTSGSSVGQINGLSVIDAGDLQFGTPSRITVSLGVGKEGVVDVQREVNMGGPTHGKGVMIISGYLESKFAYDKPLTLSARVVFEQNYGGVEGDSASSTELYALLSALSNIPIKQNFAVTGSVNQKGEIQPIGGVNEKIEGYFDVCKARGLDGTHSVLIPDSNVSNLMLKKEVIDAVVANKFHIYSAKTIDEGIEILTGVPAGQPKPSGGFEKDSIFDRADAKLRELAETCRSFHTFT
ncbi:MAG TPA: ATP-binding protein [Candidatus Bathyarchaeia archaeon]|nr:ATP-binding protein [Candidatus Bathyarchaeia archaeon]